MKVVTAIATRAKATAEKLKKKEEEPTETEEEPKPEEKPTEPEIPADVQLLTEIRDLLKQQPTSEKK